MGYTSCPHITTHQQQHQQQQQQTVTTRTTMTTTMMMSNVKSKFIFDTTTKNRKFRKVNINFIMSFWLYLILILCVLPTIIICDDGRSAAVATLTNDVTMGTEPPTTTEFDYANRGSKKFGDKCENTTECGFPGSVCDAKTRQCQCPSELPATNHIDKCGKAASINETCFFTEQCDMVVEQTECRDQRCVCRFEMIATVNKDGITECKSRIQAPVEPERYIDPTMIMILVVMALMFVIICVVLRLFSKARWRDNRTIFNTPNPRLMNVSLLRENKLAHGERRGSRMSIRMPSRQASMASLRPHSPSASTGKQEGSRRGSSNASTRSNRSNNDQSQLQPILSPQEHGHHHQHHHQPHNHHHQHHQQPREEHVTVAITELNI